MFLGVFAFGMKAQTEVKGEVLDARNRKGVEGCEVMFSHNDSIAAIAVTDKKRQFTLSGLPKGKYKVSVAREGFREATGNANVTGTLPYICHGVEGRKILDAEGLPRHALVCERHTGSGLSVEDIERQNLPLPRRDMLPLSLEEKLICYADKFFSKSGDIREEKSLDRVLRSMERHGADTLARFLLLHRLFG